MEKIKLTPKKTIEGRIWIPGYYAKIKIADKEIISSSTLKKLDKIFVDREILKEIQEDYIMYYVAGKGYYITRKIKKGFFK